LPLVCAPAPVIAMVPSPCGMVPAGSDGSRPVYRICGVIELLDAL
jgi:hypothetical protein